jgi:hypothetical protein
MNWNKFKTCGGGRNLAKVGTKVYATSFKTLGLDGGLCIWVVDANMVVYISLRGSN